MIWLLLDAGNTALKWALADEGELYPAPSSAALSAAAAALVDSMRAAAPGAATPGFAYGSSVASEADAERIDTAVRQIVPGGVRWLGAQPHFEYRGIVLSNGYAEPRQLGADRWHAMIAARQRFPGQALLVVCAGTATTVDSVDAEGHFSGGTITPGASLMAGSLAQGTARLPRSSGRYATMPDNTHDAIATGVADAQAGLIERRARQMARLGRRPRLVIAGGYGAELARHIRLDDALDELTIDEHLVLRGLWLRALQEFGGAGSDGPARTT